jgi:hypothetical protein
VNEGDKSAEKVPISDNCTQPSVNKTPEKIIYRSWIHAYVLVRK